MRNHTLKFIRLTPLLLGLSLLGGCSEQTSEAATASSAPPAVTTEQAEDTIARVGDQTITYSELTTMLNSSALVGLSVPALGTPKRSQVIITLLDKVISANLLYLDALEQGTDGKAPYTTDMKHFEEAVLITLYKSDVLIGDVSVSEQEMQDFYSANVSTETELSDDARAAIEAKLRKQKLEDRKATLRERLRAGTEITIEKGIADPANDSERADTDIIVTVGGQPISWGELQAEMAGADQRASLSPFYVDNDAERMKRLQRYIDNALMVSKARAAGLEQTPEFARRTAEYRKTHLINVHRDGLIHEWLPSDDELQDYYLDHMDSISAAESRKVQMVVVASKEEAESIKAQIDNGEITMFQAAQQFSLDPNAKRTLGDMGWVSQGTGFKALDDFTFSLEPDVVGGPVESPAGWHLVKVLDVLDARYENLDDAETHKRTLRMYLKEKMDNYVVDLRKNRFEVVVFDDELNRRFQKEADFIAELNKKAVQEGSVTKQRQQELQKWIGRPPQD
jgi:parvulin-like peptidyl-prolyl isomerase